MNSQSQIEFNFGRVTIAIIILCLIVYILSNIFNSIYSNMSYSAKNLLSRPWTLITSIFLHADLVHLSYNMFGLFIFGNIVEIHISRKKYLLLLLLSAVIANLSFGIVNRSSSVIGISGVVYSLIGAAMVRFPNTKIPLPIGPIAFPMKIYFAGPVMAIGEAVVSFIANDDIAHLAHFSGFIVGATFTYFFLNISPLQNTKEDQLQT